MKGKFSVFGAIAMVLSLVVVASAGATTGTASSPTSVGEVVPYIIGGENPGGNRTCEEVGEFEFSSDRVNYNEGTFDAPFPAGIDVTVTDGKYVSFSASFAILQGAVIVKGGNAANVYEYGPSTPLLLDPWADSGLASPINASDGSADLSNITFCWTPVPVVDMGQWCSPGYWRQPHHLDSWEATEYSPGDLYSEKIGPITRNKQGRDNNAPEDPTLLQVLQFPQYYGGDAFNAVGDLLSGAHPDVDFKGTRVEDSCPLS